MKNDSELSQELADKGKELDEAETKLLESQEKLNENAITILTLQHDKKVLEAEENQLKFKVRALTRQYNLLKSRFYKAPSGL